MAKNTWFYRQTRKRFDSRKTDSRWGIISTLLATFVFFMSLFQTFFALYLTGGEKMSLVYSVTAYILLGIAVIPLGFMIYFIFFFHKHKPKNPQENRIGNELAGIKKELSALAGLQKEWMARYGNTNTK